MYPLEQLNELEKLLEREVYPGYIQQDLEVHQAFQVIREALSRAIERGNGLSR